MNKKNCAEEKCENSFDDDKWGATRAHSDGWFIQRNGTVWCPEHIPEWVEVWRAKRRAFWMRAQRSK